MTLILALLLMVATGMLAVRNEAVKLIGMVLGLGTMLVMWSYIDALVKAAH